MKKKILLFLYFVSFQLVFVVSIFGQTLEMPQGFRVQIYAEIHSARQMALADNGVVFVGTENGKIYALVGEPNNTPKKILVYDDLKIGAGVAFADGNLYVSDKNRIFRFSNILKKLGEKITPELITDKLPSSAYHGKRYLKFSPKKKLFVSVGAPCNVCLEKNSAYGTIVNLDPETGNFEIYAKGVRNTVGFAWHPQTGELWFTDNGRDWLGDNNPPDELNRAFQADLHFGFPYFHGDNQPDSKFSAYHGKRYLKFRLGLEKNSAIAQKAPKQTYQKPVQKLGAHVASLGMIFYQGKMFPKKYRGQIFIAEHGSWNRSKKSGYRISLVRLQGNKAVSYKSFISGWTKNEKVYGRPVDLLELADGSLLISDDAFGKIYRVSYK